MVALLGAAEPTSAVGPLAGAELLLFLVQVAVLLGAALLLGRLAVRFGLPMICGELLAGVLLGPSVLMRFAPGVTDWLFPPSGQLHLLDAVGQLGVLLLVALSGLQLDLGLLRQRRATAAKVSGAALLVPLGLGIGAGFLLPDLLRTDGSSQLVFALFVGVALSVSAIPVIAKTLIDLRMMHRTVGQLILLAAAIDDAVAWLLLAVVSALATGGLTADSVVRSMLSLIGVLLFAATVGRWLVGTAMRLAARTGDQTVLVSVAVVLVIGASAGTHALRLEPVLGAFLCGILLARSTPAGFGWAQPLQAVVLAVLAPLFFAIVGLRVDLGALARPEIALSAVVVVLLAVAGKFAGAALGAALSGLSRWEGLALGAGLNARGVVELVIASVGVTIGLLNPAMYTIVVLVAVLTSVLAPPVLRFAVARIEQTDEEDQRQDRLVPTGQPLTRKVVTSESPG